MVKANGYLSACERHNASHCSGRHWSWHLVPWLPAAWWLPPPPPPQRPAFRHTGSKDTLKTRVGGRSCSTGRGIVALHRGVWLQRRAQVRQNVVRRAGARPLQRTNASAATSGSRMVSAAPIHACVVASKKRIPLGLVVVGGGGAPRLLLLLLLPLSVLLPRLGREAAASGHPPLPEAGPCAGPPPAVPPQPLGSRFARPQGGRASIATPCLAASSAIATPTAPNE